MVIIVITFNFEILRLSYCRFWCISSNVPSQQWILNGSHKSWCIQNRRAFRKVANHVALVHFCGPTICSTHLAVQFGPVILFKLQLVQLRLEHLDVFFGKARNQLANCPCWFPTFGWGSEVCMVWTSTWPPSHFFHLHARLMHSRFTKCVNSVSVCVHGSETVWVSLWCVCIPCVCGLHRYASALALIHLARTVLMHTRKKPVCCMRYFFNPTPARIHIHPYIF